MTKDEFIALTKDLPGDTEILLWDWNGVKSHWFYLGPTCGKTKPGTFTLVAGQCCDKWLESMPGPLMENLRRLVKNY